MTGWIEDYTDFLVEQTGTNYDWAESIATSICSAAIGGDKFLYTKQGIIKMNLFFLYIGPSGLARKSLPMTSFGQPLLEKYDELVGNQAQDVRTELPRRFSMESLITYFAETSQEGLLWKDEFTSMFKEANKEYMSGLIEFISELVDGRIGARMTHKRGFQQAQDVYVNILAATTPYIYDVMSNDFFIQGTGNRILYLVYDGNYDADEIPKTEDYFGSRIRAQHDSDQTAFAENLVEMNQSIIRYLHPMDDAGDMWLKWRNELEERVHKRFKDNTFDIQTVYLGKLAVNTLKLAGIHCISRLARNPQLKSALKQDEAVVIMEDMKWAMKKSEQHLKHFEKLVQQWHTRPDKWARDTECQVLLELLQKHQKGIAYFQIKRTCKWNDRTTKEVFKTLFEQRKIKAYTKKTTGRRGLVLTLVTVEHKDLDEVMNWGQIKALCGW